MALETATYISDLVSTNPTASDNMSQGDDHIRLLKSTLKSTFPNVSGAVTATHTELNYVDGVTSPLQTQLDAKAPLASPTFTGTVVLPATTSVGTVSATELGYLDGVTSALQTQIDGKAASVHTHATGDITGLGSLALLNTVGTSQITDNSVTGVKIALGSDAQGDIMFYNGTDWARLPAGTSGQVLQTNGAGANPEWGRAVNRATAITTTSGSFHDFSVPAGVTRITVIFNGVSTAGTSNIVVQLGTSSTVVTSGYTSQCSRGSGTSTTTSGLLATSTNSAAALHTGTMTLANVSGNNWVSSVVVGNSLDATSVGGGRIALSGVITTVRVTTVDGGDVFDAGSINILYE